MSLRFAALSPFQDYRREVAKLRVEVFREYPYLYEGDIRYEEHYLQRYTEARDFKCFGAFEGAKLVGASTCLPLQQESDSGISGPIASSFNPEEVFYFGESVLMKEFRGQGAGVEFFNLRENFAKSFAKVRYVFFCAVDRADDDPRKPLHYKGPYRMWRKLGYKKTKLKATIDWKEIGDCRETEHQLSFWCKQIV